MAGGSKWQTVALPDDLHKIIEEIIESGHFGYSTKAEFVKEAVREMIIRLAEAGLIDLDLKEIKRGRK